MARPVFKVLAIVFIGLPTAAVSAAMIGAIAADLFTDAPDTQAAGTASAWPAKQRPKKPSRSEEVAALVRSEDPELTAARAGYIAAEIADGVLVRHDVPDTDGAGRYVHAFVGPRFHSLSYDNKIRLSDALIKQALRTRDELEGVILVDSRSGETVASLDEHGFRITDHGLSLVPR